MKKNDAKEVLTKPLRHIAFIMDGNGRWAKKRLLPRSAGHKAGVKNIRNIVDECFFYVFSTENWNRPEKEISYLFNLLKVFFEDNIEDFVKKDVKILVSGDLEDSRIPKEVLDIINEAKARTSLCKSHIFNVLFNYGGRREIVTATKRIVKDIEEGKIGVDDINESSFGDYLYSSELKDVDLLVRTSGEERISNCVLYEIAYGEFIFNDEYWPSYSKEDLKNDLIKYSSRNRRFGGLKNE